MQDLAVLPIWSLALNGSASSTFSGGPQVVDVPRYGIVDLGAMTARLQAESDSFARLGANNPRWRLYAWGWPAVAFESPNRLPASLASLAEAQPERPVAVCRELTKRFEEVVRGSAREVADRFRAAVTDAALLVISKVTGGVERLIS